MSRRRAAIKRQVLPDPVYNSTILNKFINEIMLDGKKTTAQKIVYGALDIIKNQSEESPLEYFQKSVNNVKPSVEVKSRRVGGATYQVPMEVRSSRSQALAFKWISSNSKKRNEKTQKERLANELIDAFDNKGNSVKKKEEVHKMAEANRAFAHYRW
ncbi:30S ribosomal protein S7 [Alphaproteobacteria bacterium]|jgi:small subunit ribosomal protein S7|nr:30S ribosomal protein S7 [Alphaproteobacteria bacterium]